MDAALSLRLNKTLSYLTQINGYSDHQGMKFQPFLTTLIQYHRKQCT